MSDAETTYQQPANTFLAITRKSDDETKITLSDAEWAVVKEMRRIRHNQRHCQLQISYRDDRFMIYTVNLISTFGVDSRIAK
jgi:hypothetical protein